MEDVVCTPYLNDPTVVCDVKCNIRRSLRTLSPRHLQISVVDDFEVLLTYICDPANIDCNDLDLVQKRVDEIYTEATQTLQDAIDAAILDGGKILTWF